MHLRYGLNVAFSICGPEIILDVNNLSRNNTVASLNDFPKGDLR